MPWLVMVPGESWKYPWVLLTAGWVELSVFEVSQYRLRSSSVDWSEGGLGKYHALCRC